MIKVTVDGKTKVILDKQIHYQTESELECTYKKHRICIIAQDFGDFYATVTTKAGKYAVQGEFGGKDCRYNIKTIEDCLVVCLKNIIR